MLARCNPRTPAGRRDAAVLAFLLDTGVRVSELCGLQADAVDIDKGIATVRGKGSKERVVFFGAAIRCRVTGVTPKRLAMGIRARKPVRPYLELRSLQTEVVGL